MRYETTPPTITSKINALCKSLCANAPQYIPVLPDANSLPNECFPNVQKYIELHGGNIICGWAIWQRANIMIEAEAHAVWESPEKELIDITPHSKSETVILFLRDDKIAYKGNVIPNVRVPLTESPLVAEFIRLFNERDRIIEASPGPLCSLPIEMVERMNTINLLFDQKAGRNEPCPCQSGLKFKRCCGRFE